MIDTLLQHNKFLQTVIVWGTPNVSDIAIQKLQKAGVEIVGKVRFMKVIQFDTDSSFSDGTVCLKQKRKKWDSPHLNIIHNISLIVYI